jgi:hypothetical protein
MLTCLDRALRRGIEFLLGMMARNRGETSSAQWLTIVVSQNDEMQRTIRVHRRWCVGHRVRLTHLPKRIAFSRAPREKAIPLR